MMPIYSFSAIWIAVSLALSCLSGAACCWVWLSLKGKDARVHKTANDIVFAESVSADCGGKPIEEPPADEPPPAVFPPPLLRHINTTGAKHPQINAALRRIVCLLAALVVLNAARSGFLPLNAQSWVMPPGNIFR